MDLTPTLKAEIDAMTIRQLLGKSRFATIGAPLFQGESGTYFMKRLAEVRDQDNAAFVQASISLGW
jgi:hypothetical protein